MKKHFLKLVLALIISLSFNCAFADQSSHEQAAKNLLESMNLNKVMIETVEKMVEMEIQKNPQLSLFTDLGIIHHIRHNFLDTILNWRISNLNLKYFSGWNIYA